MRWWKDRDDFRDWLQTAAALVLGVTAAILVSPFGFRKEKRVRKIRDMRD